MVSQDLNRDERILEVAIQHLREQVILEFPNPVVELPLDHAQRRHIESKSIPMNRMDVTFSRRRSIVLAAIFAIIIGGFTVLPRETSGQKAFAQMQEAVRSLNSLVFEMRLYSGDQVTGQFQITYAKSGNVRMDSGLAVRILNAANAEYTTVDDSKRVVTIQPVYNMAAIKDKIAGSLGALFNLEPLPSTMMRTLVTDGKPTKEFKAVWDSSVATVLVDAQTNLPISIELDRGKNQDNKPIRELATNFRFNVSLAPSTFAIHTPDGYNVERIEKRDPSMSSEDLVLTTGTGVGPVRFGMSLREVRNQLGEPDSFRSEPAMVAELDKKGHLKLPIKLVPADPPQTVGVMQYLSLGLQIEVSSIEGVEWIRCYEKRLTWNRFNGMTSHGIKIGMPKLEVRAILEKEESVSRNWDQVDDRWLLNGMNIVFKDDKCAEITLGRPNPKP